MRRRMLPAKVVYPGAQFYIGLDLSFTETGLVCLMPSRPGFKSETICTLPKMGSSITRVRYIRDRIMALALMYNPAMIAIEGYAMGSKWGANQAGELGGVIRARLHDAGYPYVEVSPSSLKKFACGPKAGRDKIHVVLAVMAKWKVKIANHNVCDAFVLAKVAEAVHTGGVHKQDLLSYEREVLKKVQLREPDA